MIGIAFYLFILLVFAFGFRNVMIPVLLVGAAAAFINAYKLYRDNKRYKESEYYLITHNPRDKVKRDRGLSGEYKIYDTLRDFEGRKRFLFNLYLPKDDGETTEIDVIMIHESGVYVFESKNYSGWIFGSEYQKSWIQTLPRWHRRAHREYFMNPIAQNVLHLKWLEKALADDSLTIYSYIVFGSDCKLQNVRLKDDKHHVLLVSDLLNEVRVNAYDEGHVMNEGQIDAVYSRLVGYCMVDESVKKAHIENIQRKKNESREKKPDAPENPLTESLNDDVVKVKDVQEPVSLDAPAVETGGADEVRSELQPEDTVKHRFEWTPEDPGDKVCPMCGSKLVIRRAFRGKHSGQVFWGCSAYPKCRYTENIPVTNRDDTKFGG